MTESPVELVEGVRTEEYSYSLGRIVDILETACQQGDLKFGPDYFISTSCGQELMITTIFINHWDSLLFRLDPLQADKALFILAQDAGSGEILGHHLTSLCNRTGSKYITGWGEIILRKRGVGVCVPLELVHFDLLQGIANSQKKKVSYALGNSNLGQLRSRQEQLKTSKEPGLAQLVATIEEEQKRWQRAYGSSGVLGFNEIGEKILTPYIQEGNADLENIGEIRLTRETIKQDGRELAVGVRTSQAETKDRERFQQKSLERFEKELFPKLKAIRTVS